MLYEQDDVPATRLIAEWRGKGLAEATATGTVAAALHATCYLCDMAVQEGWMRASDVLGDDGLLHGLIHASAGDASVDLAALGNRVGELEELLTK